MIGSPTKDLHLFCNAPMMGAQPGEDLEAFMAREYANDNRGIPFRLPPHPSASEAPPDVPTGGSAPAP